MQLNLNSEKLKELMRDFYILTNIKIVVFDNLYNEILAYPEAHSEFCRIMHSNEHTRQFCLRSNADSFEQCKRSGELIVYKCHAGLIEATAPLKDNGVIIGYIMFGQITDVKNKEKLFNDIVKNYEKYDLKDSNILNYISKIKYKSTEQILAAAKILETCTYYVLLNQLVSLQKERFINKLDSFIDENITEEISVKTLCQEFNVTRTKLYETAKNNLGIGIAEYIKNKRIDLAKNLLSKTEKSITEISQAAGFDDYNYFCKVFKKETGMTARKFRNL